MQHKKWEFSTFRQPCFGLYAILCKRLISHVACPWRQLVRLGFSTAGASEHVLVRSCQETYQIQILTGSSLVLGDCDDCVYFDSEGNFGSGKMKKRTSQNFTRDQVAWLLCFEDVYSEKWNACRKNRTGLNRLETRINAFTLHLWGHQCSPELGREQPQRLHHELV
jgi:hypothetical protein